MSVRGKVPAMLWVGKQCPEWDWACSAWGGEASGALTGPEGSMRQMGGSFLETDFWLNMRRIFS